MTRGLFGDFLFNTWCIIIHLSNGKVALKGNNGKYASFQNGQSAMTCDRSSINGWEQFDLEMNNDGTFSLKGNNGN